MTDLTPLFSALSDKTRLTIVETLLSNNELSAGDLSETFDISAPAISRHLKILRQAGVLSQRRDGTHRYYKVRPEAMAAIHQWTIDHRAFWAGSLDRLDHLLALDPTGDTP
jgi:DNA-binding transcriptional ArsR family regulator